MNTLATIGGVITMEDWALIRRLAAERTPHAAIASPDRSMIEVKGSAAPSTHERLSEVRIHIRLARNAVARGTVQQSGDR